MWPFSSCGVDACSATPPSLLSTLLKPTALLSCTLLLAVFTTAFILAHVRLFPIVSRARPVESGEYFLPSHAPPALHAAHAAHAGRADRNGLCGLGGPERTVFATTVGLGAELGTVILADVSGYLDPRARAIVLGFTVKCLLGLLVLVIPAMEIHGVLNSIGVWQRAVSRIGKRRKWWPWLVFLALFAAWLFLFWSVGSVLPATSQGGADTWDLNFLTQMAVARIGVLGIASLALLSGFASVTTPWYTFGYSPTYRSKPPSETDIARRQAGLDAATEMRVSKQHRLRSLQRKQSLAQNSPRNSTSSVSSATGALDAMATGSQQHTGIGEQGGTTSVAGKFWSSIKTAVTGDPDAREIRILQLEIQGLEDMESRLASGLAALMERKKEGERMKTKLGRWVIRPTELGFAVYCVYRVVMTIILVSLRLIWPTPSTPTTKGSSIWSPAPPPAQDDDLASVDPITRFLAILTMKLGLADRDNIDITAWARTIAFLLSGVIIFGSANSVVQTFRLVGRWVPKRWGVMNAARRNLALAVSQVGGMYVIGAAVMLRGRVGGSISGRESLMGYFAQGSDVFGILGEGTRVFVDRWFEGWFLYAALATVFGVLVVGWLSKGDDMVVTGVGDEEEWEEKGGVELGWKRS